MVGNNFINNNIFIQKAEDNLILIDPNKVFLTDGSVSERNVEQENLIMYANLEAKMYPRTKLIVGAPIDDQIQNQIVASTNFLKPNGDTFLNNSYTDEITGKGSLKNVGANQVKINQFNVPDKSNDFYFKQSTLNNEDTGLLGIESISIKNSRSFTPVVDITLIDTMGRALFQKGENSEYAFFFNLPYPTFYLTIKGYYGKAIRYPLIMTKFQASFESSTGNYRVQLSFYSYKYTVLAETQVAALFATPFMYTSQYTITSQSQTPSQAAALVSTGNETNNVRTFRNSRGNELIQQTYKKYKSLGLVKPDFPELTFPQFKAKIQAFQKYIESSFGQEQLTPISNADSYFELLTTFRKDVYDTSLNYSWISKNIDLTRKFVLKNNSQDNQQIIVWIFNEQNRSSSQNATRALSELEYIVTNFKEQLQQNETFGSNGTFKVDGNTYSSSVKSANEFNGAYSQNLTKIIQNSFVQKVTESDIDWKQTYQVRFSNEPTPDQLSNFQKQESVFFNISTIESLAGVTFPKYTFIFDGNTKFLGILDRCFKELDQQKQFVVKYLSEFLAKKVQGPDGLGFSPTIRNVMAIIFASVEGYYRLLEKVHTDAWNQRTNPIRKKAVYSTTENVSPDIVNNIRNTNNNSIENTPVYPWPLYLKQDSNNNDQFVSKYPGDESEISNTRGSDYLVWPEVQFVEEYIRALQRSQEISSEVAGNVADVDDGTKVNRITVNAVEFPTSNRILSDYQDVKFLFEIYERIFLQTFWDRLSTTNALSLNVVDSLSEMEVVNIRSSLNGLSNPNLTKILKNFNLNSIDYLLILRQISNEGVGLSWQQYIRGDFTSDYLRIITTKDFSILDSTTINSGFLNSNKNPDILSNVKEYVKSTKSTTNDFLDLYPFIDPTWASKNLSSFNNQSNIYNTTRSLFLNDNSNYITNFENAANYQTTTNKPFVNGSYLVNTNPVIPNTQLVQQTGNNQFVGFNQYYENKIVQKKYNITEGLLNYSGNTGKLQARQVVSILNTPFFVNSLIEGVTKQKNNEAYPYVTSAYLFLNSLPLSSLREKYKTINDPTNPSTINELDYIFTTLTKFGAIHRLPYSWILKYGAIWHRYKKYITQKVDILDPIWKNIDVRKIYDPVTDDLKKVYTIRDFSNQPVDIVAQTLYTSSIGPTTSRIIKNVGFYPSLINDLLFFFTGQNLLTGYTNNDLNLLVTEGLNVGATAANINEPFGVIPGIQNIATSLTFNGWFVTFDTSNSTKFNLSLRNKTILLPSFGTNLNQVLYECFVSQSNNTIMVQSITGNTAVDDGSVRFFWNSPNFGYFELSSITKPKYNEYFKKITPSDGNENSFELSFEYSNIEEIFGVFKTEILDEFEGHFLNFCKSQTTESIDGTIQTEFLINQEPVITFQTLMQNCFSVDSVSKNNISVIDYVDRCGQSQASNITNTIQNFLNREIAFKFGNPSNFDRKVFGTLTTLPNYRVFDRIQYGSYVSGTLPGDGTNITLQQSKNLNPNAWKNMELYVGFASTEGLNYSNQGSFYTDFFIDLNVEFNSNNVVVFSNLIKVYGTQKLLSSVNGDVYDQFQFIQDINTYLTEKNTFLNLVLNNTLTTLNKVLPQIDNTNVTPIYSSYDGPQSKLELWTTFKAFNDKWVAGAEFGERTLFEQVIFLDRANRDVGDKILVDILALNRYFDSFPSLNSRVIDLISNIVSQNNFYMMPMPAYVNFWGQTSVQNGTTPTRQSYSVQDKANELFGTYDNVDVRYSEPKFLCYYVGNPSEHLDMKNNSSYLWRTDAFDISNSNNSLRFDIKNKTDWNNSNMVVGFNVDFGIRNQSIFTSIQLDQNSAAATTEANRVIAETAAQAAGVKTSLANVGLYNFYKVRSYTARIECLGNVMIQPTMYFNLQHVPMFRGPYMIQSVEHKIEQGRFTTLFEGIRIPFYSIPLIDKQLESINQNLFSQLFKEVRSKKETSLISANQTTNVITIGNSVQTNLSYRPTDSSLCLSSIVSSKIPYNRFDGVSGFTTQITFADFAKKLKSVTNPKVRALIFFTAYANGHKDGKISCFNYDLGGTPLGGYSIPNIDYGQLNRFLKPEFCCKQFPNGDRVPFATFANFEQSINFIQNTYESIISQKIPNIEYNNVWDTEANLRINLTILWIYYWPRKRFQNEEQFKKWFDSSGNGDALLTLSGEVVDLLKVYKLYTF